MVFASLNVHRNLIILKPIKTELPYQMIKMVFWNKNYVDQIIQIKNVIILHLVYT